MNITEEWRVYDPKDPRTHPDGVARVEIEFDDGRVFYGRYSRERDSFTTADTTPVIQHKAMALHQQDARRVTRLIHPNIKVFKRENSICRELNIANRKKISAKMFA